MRLAPVLLAVVLTAGCTTAPDAAPTPSSSSLRAPSSSLSISGGDAGPRADTGIALADAERRLSRAEPGSRPFTAAARQEQVAYRTWSDHPGWDHFILGLLPQRLRPIARANVEARRALRSIYPDSPSELPRELPAWHIQRPTPLDRLESAYREAERRTGVDRATLAAINFVESDFGRIQGTSDAGAQGPMQFIPATWAAYGAGGDIHDPHDAILGAGRLLAANGFADHPQEALHHYNDSDGYVRAVTLLAQVITQQPRALAAFHEWQVYYLTSRGPVLLPEGYDEQRPVPVGRWLRVHHSGG